MTLPPQIELRGRCAEADDLSGIIFRMQITAGYKNPYSIFFPKTNASGHTRLTAKEIEMQFTDHGIWRSWTTTVRSRKRTSLSLSTFGSHATFATTPTMF